MMNSITHPRQQDQETGPGEQKFDRRRFPKGSFLVGALALPGGGGYTIEARLTAHST